jgi:hypothetical protein
MKKSELRQIIKEELEKVETGGRAAGEISYEEVKRLINSKEYTKVGQYFLGKNPNAIYRIQPDGDIDEIEYNSNFMGGVVYKTIAKKNNKVKRPIAELSKITNNK